MSKRFEVKIHLEVREINSGGDLDDFFDITSCYHDLPLEGLLAVESVLIGSAAKLTEMGVIVSEEKKHLSPEKAKTAKSMLKGIV